MIVALFLCGYHFTGTILQGDYPVQGYSQYYVGRKIMIDGLLVRFLFGFKVGEGEVKFIKGSAC